MDFISLRKIYPFTKNEAKEFRHLPAIVENYREAIVAAIARAHHCDWQTTATLAALYDDTKLTKLLHDKANYTPTDNMVHWYLNCFPEDHSANRDFLRKLVEWLHTLPTRPTANELHDLVDYFLGSNLNRDKKFSFKGRTLKSVKALADAWHHELDRRNAAQAAAKVTANLKANWPARDYSYAVKGNCDFVELTSGEALLEEGRRQHNCVFSYIGACVSGKTSIVSMRSTHASSRAHLTIEINNFYRQIVQIREVCNKPPTNEEMRLVRQFASAKNLRIA